MISDEESKTQFLKIFYICAVLYIAKPLFK